MKGLTGLFLLFLMQTAAAQYYYKDIIVTRQTIEKWKNFKNNKVSSVQLSSFESNGQPTDGFTCTQTMAPDFSTISTYTVASSSTPTNLTAYYDSRGMLIKTIDTSDTYQSSSEYTYNADGQVLTITNTSLETDNEVKATETHIWKYDGNGSPLSMLKIKQGNDSTEISFVKDEKGNIAEEHAVHNKEALPTVYYYYNDSHELTDIVRYNVKAQRLLPDYMFEYNDAGRVSTMLFVPEGSTNYQRWVYEYGSNGLKTQDTCFDKQKQMIGKIEYRYSYR